MIKQLITLPRLGKKIFLVGFDFILLCGSIWLALFVRLEELMPQILVDHGAKLIFAPLVTLPIFVYLGLYNAVIRYIAPRFVVTILKGVTLAAGCLILVVVLGGIHGFPRSVFTLYMMIAAALIGGSRLMAREFLALPLIGEKGKMLVAIYGAGAAGTQICKALQSSPEFQPLVFLDDNRELHGLDILGCKVHAPEDLSFLIERFSLEEIVLSMPSESLTRRKEIFEFLQQFPVVVKTLPGIPEMVAGEIQVDDLRQVEIEDLLGRDPVRPDECLLRACVEGKVVLVTGAGGSIGSELCTQIAELCPTRLVLLEINEYALYHKEKELRGRFPDLSIIAVLGSVGDAPRLSRLLDTHGVQTIYHAAAYKHVPMVEANLFEGVKNNIFGTRALAGAAIEAGVETFILISTDKAVRPTNIMGATKRFAEMILQGLTQAGSPTRFTMVRFGNVLGSSGSVVPLFREQIRKGGPVTVTHPEITRYFMTIPEAAQLVIQAGSMGQGGDVFVLDMGESVKILDLARKMIRLSGLTVRADDGQSGDIEISYTGLRPGEKLYEELLIGDNVFPTEHTRIKRAEEACPSWSQVEAYLSQLNEAVTHFDSALVREIFLNADIGYRAESSLVDVSTRPKPTRILSGTKQKQVV